MRVDLDNTNKKVLNLFEGTHMYQIDALPHHMRKAQRVYLDVHFNIPLGFMKRSIEHELWKTSQT